MKVTFEKVRNHILALLVLLTCLFCCNIPVQAENLHGVLYNIYDINSQTFSGYFNDGVEASKGGTISAVVMDLEEPYHSMGQILYRTHNANVGWYDWVSNGQIMGDSSNPIQAIRITTNGTLRYTVDVFYRLFSPGYGWSGWARNGEAAGSEGLGRDCSVLQVLITEKGTLPPGQVGSAFTQRGWTWPVVGYRSISSPFGPRNGAHHDGFDIPAPGGTPIVSAKTGVVKLAAPDGNFGNCVCVQHDSGETVYYAHMSQIGCVVNQRVGEGQVIGYVGTTGNSLGNHLHMEIYNDWEENVDPVTYY